MNEATALEKTPSPDGQAPVPVKPVPGPRGLPLIGVLPSLLRDPFGFCMATAAAHEGLARLRVGPMSVYLVSHPDYAQHVLVTNAKNYNKGPIMRGIRVALGDGLFTSDGELWRRQRRLMQPAFHQRQIREMVDAIREETLRHLETWAPAIAAGRPVDILAETIRVNIRIVLRTLFGSAVSDDQVNDMVSATDGVFGGMSKRLWAFFMPTWLPLPGMRAYRRAIRALEDRVYAIIASRRARQVETGDLLSSLLAARDEETGETMSDRQLRDEIFTFFLAGYESTATSVSWAWYLLARNPDVARRLREELDSTLGDGGPVYDDLARLPYLRRVVDEAFRLYPAFPMYFRTAIDRDRVGPFEIPGRSSIIISPYATQHDPRHWEDPERFDPDRFTAERFTEAAANAYYPFGKGQRICIGKAMALTTAQMLIAIIARRFEIELVPGHRVEPHFAMTIPPKGGLPLLLRSR
jgi:cytochrome P450